MKLTNENPNYSASIVKIHNLLPLEGLDNLVGFPIYGYQALLSKDHTIGELGILFPPECKLSQEFCKENNLYREPTLNKDTTKKSYLEPSGRVKCLKLRGHKSTCLWMPLNSLDSFCDTNKLKEGDSFTHINGKEICSKYFVRTNKVKSNKIKGQNRKVNIVDEKVFKQHVETEHFLRNLKHFKNTDWIIVTEKIHSVSGRFANLPVNRNLTFFEKVSKFLGCKVQETEYKLVAGSRRCVKLSGKDNPGYYNQDIWNAILERIGHLIPKNTVIYSEIVGWDGNKALQKDYTYQLPQGSIDNYIYRIASVNDDGFMIDWSWTQVKKFCSENRLKYVPEIWQGWFKDFDYRDYEDKKFKEELGLEQCLSLDSEAPCSEGLVIRHENGYIPYLTKFKSPEFYLHEGNSAECGRDIETEESV